MKKILVIIFLSVSINANAQFDIIGIIRAGIKKVIVAVDLKIQKLQNKTIWLQNAQKTLENKMSKLKLTEISDWVNKQKELYREYFEELKKVKNAIAYYHRVKDLIEDQAAMVKEYKAAWAIFRTDKNFTRDELHFMSGVYDGMLNESIRNLDQLLLVINSFATQMSDAKRMEIINTAADKIEETFLDLKSFNNQNKAMSLQRSFERGEIEYSKRLYGL
jgi:ATP-dependent 26S proteasome regulatory subunit